MPNSPDSLSSSFPPPSGRLLRALNRRRLGRCAAFGLALASLALFMACKKEESGSVKDAAVAQGLSALVAGYSQGLIPAKGPILVRFVSPVSERDGKLTGALRLEPEVSGLSRWVDDRTLEFVPDKPMERGKAYRVIVALGKLVTAPKSLETFSFEVKPLRQEFQVAYDGLQRQQGASGAEGEAGRRYAVTGQLSLADEADTAAIARMPRVRQIGLPGAGDDGRELSLRWDMRAGAKEQRFRVEGIERGESESRVVWRWEGKPVGAEAERRDTLLVPAIGDFRVQSVQASGEEDAYVSVRLSDPPRAGQDFRGLVRVEGQASLRFEIRDLELRVYSGREWLGQKSVIVDGALKSSEGARLKNPGTWVVAFEPIKPSVRFVGKGVILPGESGYHLPFEAVNLRAVRVTVTRVYADNLPQFFQVNALSGTRELRRVGRPILRKTVPLGAGAGGRARWVRYGLDLDELRSKEPEPGALYAVELSFAREHSTYPCADDSAAGATAAASAGAAEAVEDWDAYVDPESSGWDGIETWVQDDEPYFWEERENPCAGSYYRYGRTAARNVLLSEIGLIAKGSWPGKILVAANRLTTAKPWSGVTLEALDFQHRVVARALTDASGIASLEPPREGSRPVLIRASQGEQRGYLKIDPTSALQMGHFDVGGQAYQEGLKGYLFGERGVWRPGDSLHLTFILEDRKGRFPKRQPVVFELRDPRGRLAVSQAKVSSTGFYDFGTATGPEDPTGRWTAKVKAGPAVFEQPLRIETVMPNRLKIKADFAPRVLEASQPVRGSLDVSWLTGANAGGLRADVEMTFTPEPLTFPKHSEFVFHDPSRAFQPETHELFAGKLDARGHAEFESRVDLEGQAPGGLLARFRTRVMEPGGASSVDRVSQAFHPYGTYIGLKLPKGDRARGMLLTDTNHTVSLAAVDPEGKPIAKRRVEITFEKIAWRWWWDAGEDEASYLARESATLLQKEEVALENGKGTWNLRLDYPQWGRYLLKACDLDASGPGHCTGKIFYMDWPGWAGRAQREGDGGGAAMAPLATDKPAYTVGESIRLTLPPAPQGRAWVTVEKAGAVLSQQWVELGDKETVQSLPATAEMAPNAYVYATVLQPHAQTANDRPMRLYNVLPVMVEDPATRLRPTLEVKPAVFRPGEKAEIEVAEASGRPMEYVVAVVDEGLLDLTRFPTPDPWGHFYAREALSTHTWDLYDYVSGALGARLERLLPIGGDEGLAEKEGKKGNRFPPMVKFLGPFTLEKGKTARHAFEVPQYVGSVRAMVVAGRDGAYGKAEKAVPVRKPLMLLGTLPRSLAPGERCDLPVSVFALESKVKEAVVTLETEGPLRVTGEKRKTLAFAEPSDQLVTFTVTAPEEAGWAKVRLKASGAGESAEQTLEIEVRNPNAPRTETVAATLESGRPWSGRLPAPGVAGSNRAVIELSRIPPIDLERNLRYLIHYPYGCLEQTVSAAFPQLFLGSLAALPKETLQRIDRHVQTAIARLRHFQMPGGAFAYWPGDQAANAWSNLWAGHFLLEAQTKGHAVPTSMLSPWLQAAKSAAQAWSDGGGVQSSQRSLQAYRLYLLARAGQADVGAMNRLHEVKGLGRVEALQLGAAYFLAGQPEAGRRQAQGLRAPAELSPPEEAERQATFASELRDKAVVLDALSWMGEKDAADLWMRAVAKEVSADGHAHHTQSLGFALMAVGRYAEKLAAKGEAVTYRIEAGGMERKGSFTQPLLQVPFSEKETQAWLAGDGAVRVEHQAGGALFLSLQVTGIPPLKPGPEKGEGLVLETGYFDATGKSISPERLTQGQDFVVQYRARLSGAERRRVEHLALSALMPSGWEIRNTRLDPAGGAGASLTASQSRQNAWWDGGRDRSLFEYQDVRDDRVNTFFSLAPGEEKTFRFHLQAAYLGEYHLPATVFEAMYRPELRVQSAAMKVSVVAAGSDGG